MRTHIICTKCNGMLLSACAGEDDRSRNISIVQCSSPFCELEKAATIDKYLSQLDVHFEMAKPPPTASHRQQVTSSSQSAEKLHVNA